jgi:WhiB family redox-sensing transcriptional regulator
MRPPPSTRLSADDIAAMFGMPDVDDRVLDWQNRAACSQQDPEAFFPEKGGSPQIAKQVCLSFCDVRDECLAYALSNDERFGVWGGLTERERRKMKRTQARE